MANRNTDQKPRKEPKKFTFTLTLPGVFSLMSGLALVVTFFFVMGLLIGRGYRPEAEVPQLARIMPEPASQAQAPGQEAEDGDQTLRPEDLEFDEQLGKKPDEVQAEAEKEAEKARAEEQLKKSREAAEKAAAQQAAARKKAQEKAAATFEDAEPKPGEQVFNYVYQAASFRKRQMAEALASNISDKGLEGYVDTTQVGENTWHRVFVRYRGTPTQTNAMKAVLEQLGISKPLMRKKQPVAE